MGLRYIHVLLKDIEEHGDRPANLAAYLRARSAYADKDGYFACSYKQIEKAIGQKRSIAEKCRKVLQDKGLIECICDAGNKTKYKVMDTNEKSFKGKPAARSQARTPSSRSTSTSRVRYVPRDTSNIGRTNKVSHWTDGIRAAIRPAKAEN